MKRREFITLAGGAAVTWPVAARAQQPARTRRIASKNAAELVALGPDVILASSSAAVAPLLEATRTIPIVFAGIADPVAAGYVENLARRAATPPALPSTNIPSVENGWRCSRRLRRAWREQQSFVHLTSRPVLASSAPSRRCRLRLGWSCAPSTCATPPRSSVHSRSSLRVRTAA
jgi:ABC transporter substrate binding protein